MHAAPQGVPTGSRRGFRQAAQPWNGGDVTPWLGVAAASLATGLILQPILIPWLRRRGVMDVPNHRSSHAVVTPRGGGIAVLVALGVGLAVAQITWQCWLVYLGAVALGLLGLLDDFGGVDARLRLVALLAVGAIGGAVLDSPAPVLLAIPIMAFWTAAYVNAFNFMDGINGISALSGMVAGLSYVAMGVQYSSSALAALGAALFGACLSFLPFNLPRARVFLGDVGSYGLGFSIAGSAWLAWAAGVPPLLALAPTLVYVADTGWTLVRRARAGAPLMEAHREHAYQRLVAGGLSHAHVSLGVAATSVGVVLAAWAGMRFGILGVALSVTAIAAILAVYLWAPNRRAVAVAQ